MRRKLLDLCSHGFMLMIQRKEDPEHLQGTRWPSMNSSVSLLRDSILGCYPVTLTTMPIWPLRQRRARKTLWLQGMGHERGMFFPLQLPPSIHAAETPHVHYADLNTPLTQLEQKKKLEEDDFRVPIFVHSGMGQDHSKNYNGLDKERVSSLSPASFKSASNLSSREKTEGPLKQTNASTYDCSDRPASNFSRLQNSADILRREYRAESQSDNTVPVQGDGVSNEPIRGEDYGNSSILMRDLQPEEQRNPNNSSNGDAVSEASMVDSISGMDLSPDDVVGIIGQKHFWKARKAIVNQQRVFAVQVFELHRLIKVQRLIAGSPHLLLEDNAYLGNALKGSPVKKLPLEYIVKATQNIVKHKDVSEKANHKMEYSAENGVGKASLSSVQNGSQPSNYRPFSGNPSPTTVTTDTKTGSWSFNQPPGQQWLIPVMSPSEGLVYKPYPGPGFVGPVCGPPGPTPMMGNFLNYGVPPSLHHYQGLGVAPFAHPPGHGYFPPFGMPVMNPAMSGSAAEQMNHFSGQAWHSPLSGGGSDFNMQCQSSCNVSSQKNGDVSNVVKLLASKDNSEVQVSTASSPSERAQATGVVHATNGSNALPLFPTSPPVNVPDGVPQARDAELPSRVIKVVPHNARSATASVARIFQSIQEERKQYDTV